jgi:hypothetical protein
MKQDSKPHIMRQSDRDIVPSVAATLSATTSTWPRLGDRCCLYSQDPFVKPETPWVRKPCWRGYLVACCGGSCLMRTKSGIPNVPCRLTSHDPAFVVYIGVEQTQQSTASALCFVLKSHTLRLDRDSKTRHVDKKWAR